MLDADKIRSDFPILKRKVRGKPLIYLDNAATSQKPKQVIEAVSNYYENYNANVHRGVHKLSEEATESFEAVRKKVGSFVGVRDSSQIVFTRNATESINLVAYSWGRKNIKKGDEILLTQMEHHSNLVPWQILANEVGAKLKFIPIDQKGELEIEQINKLVNGKTILVALTHVSNVLGTINPVKEIVAKVKILNSNVQILVDGAQAAPHMKVNVQEIKPDFYVFTGHKMLGPTGVGVLYAKKELLEEMEPFLAGGDMILEVDWERSSWNSVPWKFEAGTPNVAGAVGLGEAVGYLNKIRMENIREHEKELANYALAKLSEIENLIVYGSKDIEKRAGVISYNIVKEGSVAIHPHDLASILDQEGIAIRSGHHCAQPLMKVLKIPAAARVSFYLYNTESEIDKLIIALEKAKQIFKI